jgi:hypothetical protein
MPKLGVSDTAVLIGFDRNGGCVYSATMPLAEYWEATHVWDSAKGVTSLKLRVVHGYLFDSRGRLIQRFESTFNPTSGDFESGWARDEAGNLLPG